MDKLAGYHQYKRPNGEPFAAPGIKVYSYKDANTRRRKFSIDELPPDWPKKKCPVCGKTKDRHNKACKPCYQKIRRIMIQLTCVYCGTVFERIISELDKMHRRGHKDVYCSKACSESHHAVKHHRRCLVCDKPTPKKTMKYCSKKCKASRREKDLAPKVCSVCDAQFQPKSYRTVYCSRACANRAHSRRMRGAGNSHHKTGTSYANWFRSMRPIILERDKYACVACGNTEKLVIHHVNHRPQFNEAHNLITLCSTCHMVHHKSKVSPFPWLKILALWRPMTEWQKSKSIKLEAKYSMHVYDIYRH
jgi:predicted nucleic acid-binding Zn ribbon protein